MHLKSLIKFYIVLKLKSSALQKKQAWFAHAQFELKLMNLNLLLNLIKNW
jgi:hypothetical protein